MKCEYCDSSFEGNFCPYCGAKAPATNVPKQVSATPIQQSGYVDARPVAKPVTAKKPFYKRWWFWVIIVVVSIGIISRIFGNNNENPSEKTRRDNTSAETTTNDTKIKAPKASTSLINQKVEDVVQLFSNAGFENIRIKGNGELIIGFLHSEGDVESVSFFPNR